MSTSIDMKFEIAVIPVTDVDRAKAFYANLGWRLDADYDDGKGFRVLQFTPPGSAWCAEQAHGVYETKVGKGRDENWSDWYAAYVVAEQSGAKLPE